MTGLALALAVLLAIEAEDWPPAHKLAAVTGHGGMAAGLDATGALSVLRWPGPGGPNQFRDTRAADGAGERGGRWRIEAGGEWRWFGDPAARLRQEYLSPGSAIVVTTCEWADGLSARQLSGVLPDRDLFVSTIEVRGTPSPPRLLWSAEFAPRTRQLPEIAAEASLLDAASGFAAFSDAGSGHVWNFRPVDPGAEDWARARSLARAGKPPLDWATFGEGVWIGITGAATVRRVSVADGLGQPIPAGASGDASTSARTGIARSSIEAGVEFEGGAYRSWIAIGISENYERARELLDASAAASSAMADDSAPRAPVPPKLAKLDSSFQPHALVHEATLRALRDPETGFTIRGLEGDPMRARDWPRDGVIAAWSFFECGETEAAWKSIEAYLSLVRSTDEPRRPFGSMPESVYTSGEMASPHFVVDDRGPARLLWVARRMLDSRGPNAKAEWLREHWAAIEAAAEFLSGWADARRGAPLYARDPIAMRDPETQDRVFSAYAGMHASLLLAAYAEKPVPASWRDRLAQLRDIAQQILSGREDWHAGEALILECEGISGDALVRAYEIACQRLEDSVRRDVVTDAGLLLQVALLHEHLPARTPLPSGNTVASVLRRIAVPAAPDLIGPDLRVSSRLLPALLRLQAPEASLSSPPETVER